MWTSTKSRKREHLKVDIFDRPLSGWVKTIQEDDSQAKFSFSKNWPTFEVNLASPLLVTVRQDTKGSIFKRSFV